MKTWDHIVSLPPFLKGVGGGLKFPKILLRGGSEFSKNQRGKLKGGGGGHENAQF